MQHAPSNHRWLRLAFIAIWIGLGGAVFAGAQSVLYSFAHSRSAPGAMPGFLETDGISFYGTTIKSRNGRGVIFKLGADGTYQVLHDFTGGESSAGTEYGFDAGYPLTLSGSTLYGTARFSGVGGGSRGGLLFAIETDGSNYRVLHQFGGLISTGAGIDDGAEPVGRLVVRDGVIYGGTWSGGALIGSFGPRTPGVIYKLNTNGTGYTILHNFDIRVENEKMIGALSLVGNTLYGANCNNPIGGSIFKVNTDGTGYVPDLHVFQHANTGDGIRTGGDGMIAIGTTFYGLTTQINPSGVGAVFSVFAFDTLTNNYSVVCVTNIKAKGQRSGYGSLVAIGDTLYGVTGSGGGIGKGAIFRVQLDGTGYERLFSFAVARKGIIPSGALRASADGTTLFGTTLAGGKMDRGAIFKYIIPPR